MPPRLVPLSASPCPSKPETARPARAATPYAVPGGSYLLEGAPAMWTAVPTLWLLFCAGSVIALHHFDPHRRRR
jgi:hypothetical protein